MQHKLIWPVSTWLTAKQTKHPPLEVGGNFTISQLGAEHVKGRRRYWRKRRAGRVKAYESRSSHSPACRLRHGSKTRETLRYGKVCEGVAVTAPRSTFSWDEFKLAVFLRRQRTIILWPSKKNDCTALNMGLLPGFPNLLQQGWGLGLRRTWWPFFATKRQNARSCTLAGCQGVQELQAHRLTTQATRKKKQPRRRWQPVNQDLFGSHLQLTTPSIARRERFFYYWEASAGRWIRRRPRPRFTETSHCAWKSFTHRKAEITVLASLASSIRKAAEYPWSGPLNMVFDRTGFKTGLHQVTNRLICPLFGSSREVLNGCVCGQRLPEEEK